MFGSVPLLPFILAATALLAAGLAAFNWLSNGRASHLRLPLDALGEPRVFLFRDGYLVSSERGTGFLLPHPVNRMTAWDDLAIALSDLLPGAGAAMDTLARTGAGFRLEGTLGRDKLHLLGLRDGPDIRISLSTADEAQAAVRVDAQILAALQAENQLLTQSHNAASGLVWVLNENDEVIWANGPYQDEVIRCFGTEAAAAWPLPSLFPNRGTPPRGPVRRSLGGDRERGSERWYEVVLCPERDGVRHAHAQPINRVIAAEEGLRRFIDTLTRTVTVLPVGLAIFDPHQKLVMFNPPFLDMTGLDGAWLAGRPDLADLFHTLRDLQGRAMPEAWSEWFSRLDMRSGSSDFAPWSERWTQSDGLSYRLTARPQPDGALALLLEDVTAEVNLFTRNKSETALFKAMLDAGDAAVAAIGPDGQVAHMNMQMAAMLAPGRDAPATLDGVIRGLASLCDPAPIWGELRHLGQGPEPISEWTEIIPMKTEGGLEVTVTPLPEGPLVLHVRQVPQASIGPSEIDPMRVAARALLRSAKPDAQPRVG